MSDKASKALAVASRIIIRALGSRANNDAFCTLLVHRIFEKQQATSCFIAVLRNDSNIEAVGQYGFAQGLFDNVTMSIWKPSGVSDAIRTQLVQKIDSDEHYHQVYPDNNAPGLSGSGYIAIPFVGADNSVGAVGITFHSNLSEIDLYDEVIELIQLAAPFFTQLNGAGQTSSAGSPLDFDKLSGKNEVTLSKREEDIVLLMSKGQTNQEIGVAMHLSESSIRSASVGLFKNLGVHSRKDAVIAARHLGFLATLPIAKALTVAAPNILGTA